MSLKLLLDTLRISSKEAIVNGDSQNTDGLKSYLHIEREVERRLRTTILKASEEKGAQLIFVIGNVGDGKSHLLSKMRSDLSEQLKGFRVHNDATESDDVNKTYSTKCLFRP
jgi:DNA phosphorothioation-dependent restriction protein DptF